MEILQTVFNWTFDNLLIPVGDSLNTVFTVLIMFGLAYWTFFWQVKYNKQAETDADQLQ